MDMSKSYDTLLNDQRRGYVPNVLQEGQPAAEFIYKTATLPIGTLGQSNVISDFVSIGLWNHALYGAILTPTTAGTEWVDAEVIGYLSEKPVVRFPVQFALNAASAGAFVGGAPVSVMTGATTGMEDCILVNAPAFNTSPVNLSPFRFQASIDRVEFNVRRAVTASAVLLVLGLKSTNV